MWRLELLAPLSPDERTMLAALLAKVLVELERRRGLDAQGSGPLPERSGLKFRPARYHISK